jgi:transposase
MRTFTSTHVLIIALGVGVATSFTTQGHASVVWGSKRARMEQTAPAPSKLQPLSIRSPQHRSNTALSVLLDVPDGFFTVTFPMLGFLLALSKNFVRVRMEENAWEQRLEEGRLERLRSDPTLTELDLRRKEASMEWSAYGKPRMEEERAEKDRRQETSGATMKDTGRKSRTKVMDRDEEEDEDEIDPREYRMTDDEIDTFESEYGVEYDPYYDDPYAEDELPEDKFNLDKLYGDRIYESGEVFYKDKESGLYYRQGAKPRNVNFWG